MNKKIIDAQIFRTKISSKTIWLFVLLKDSNNIEGWGEATLSGKDNEIFKIKDKTFEIILNKIYISPLEFKNIRLLKKYCSSVNKLSNNAMSMGYSRSN